MNIINNHSNSTKFTVPHLTASWLLSSV